MVIYKSHSKKLFFLTFFLLALIITFPSYAFLKQNNFSSSHEIKLFLEKNGIEFEENNQLKKYVFKLNETYFIDQSNNKKFYRIDYEPNFETLLLKVDTKYFAFNIKKNVFYILYDDLKIDKKYSFNSFNVEEFLFKIKSNKDEIDKEVIVKKEINKKNSISNHKTNLNNTNYSKTEKNTKIDIFFQNNPLIPYLLALIVYLIVPIYLWFVIIKKCLKISKKYNYNFIFSKSFLLILSGTIIIVLNFLSISEINFTFILGILIISIGIYINYKRLGKNFLLFSLGQFLSIITLIILLMMIGSGLKKFSEYFSKK